MPTGSPFYETKESLQKQVDNYFETLGDDPMTITGLAIHLGYCSRQSIYDLEEREDFSYTIKRARLKIENSYEKSLRNGKNASGDIFALKNFGWTDKQHFEHSGPNGKPLKHEVVFQNYDSSDEG